MSKNDTSLNILAMQGSKHKNNARGLLLAIQKVFNE